MDGGLSSFSDTPMFHYVVETQLLMCGISRAWSKTITAGNICSGFRRAGIVPFNPDALHLSKKSEVSESTGTTNEGENYPNIANSLSFTPAEEGFFSTRFEEGYHLHDPKFAWPNGPASVGRQLSTSTYYRPFPV